VLVGPGSRHWAGQQAVAMGLEGQSMGGGDVTGDKGFLSSGQWSGTDTGMTREGYLYTVSLMVTLPCQGQA